MDNSTQNSTSYFTVDRVVQEIIPLIVEIIGICGSLFFLCIFIWRRKSIKISPTVRIALCHLLVVDTLFLTLAMYDDIYYDMVSNQPLIDHSQFCCFSVLVTLSTLVSLQGYVQCIISIERVVAIVNPFKVKLLVTRKRMIYSLAIVSIAIFLVRIIYTVSTYSFEYVLHNSTEPFDNRQVTYFHGSCYIRGEPIRTLLIMGIFDSIMYCMIPTVVLLSCTCLIIVYLYRHRRMQMMSTLTLSATDRRLCVILVVMDVIYMATSIPHIVDIYSHVALNSAEDTVMEAFHKLPVRFTRLAAATDWIVLLCFSSQVRSVVISLICRQRRRRRRLQREGMLLQRTGIFRTS